MSEEYKIPYVSQSREGMPLHGDWDAWDPTTPIHKYLKCGEKDMKQNKEKSLLTVVITDSSYYYNPDPDDHQQRRATIDVHRGRVRIIRRTGVKHTSYYGHNESHLTKDLFDLCPRAFMPDHIMYEIKKYTKIFDKKEEKVKIDKNIKPTQVKGGRSGQILVSNGTHATWRDPIEESMERELPSDANLGDVLQFNGVKWVAEPAPELTHSVEEIEVLRTQVATQETLLDLAKSTHKRALNILADRVEVLENPKDKEMQEENNTFTVAAKHILDNTKLRNEVQVFTDEGIHVEGKLGQMCYEARGDVKEMGIKALVKTKAKFFLHSDNAQPLLKDYLQLVKYYEENESKKARFSKPKMSMVSKAWMTAKVATVGSTIATAATYLL